jgi:hypothetical protein
MKDLRVTVMKCTTIIEAKGGAHLYELLEDGAVITSVEAWVNGEMVDRDTYELTTKTYTYHTDQRCDGTLCVHTQTMCPAYYPANGFPCSRELHHSGPHIGCMPPGSPKPKDHNLVIW